MVILFGMCNNAPPFKKGRLKTQNGNLPFSDDLISKNPPHRKMNK